MKDSPENIPAEAMQALSELPANLALIRVENDSMAAMAAARPRNLVQIAKGLVDQIREFPDFARVVLYSRPVGRDDDTGEQKIATGLSIRAAEAIAEAYGFNRVWSEVKLMPDGNAQVSASFTDFQRGRVTSASVLVSRVFKMRSGQMKTHSQDRFLDVVCKAAQSKLIRDVIVRSVPPALKTTLELAVRTSVKISDRTAEQIIEYFGAHGVAQAEIETFLGAPRTGWSDVHRQKLSEIKNAIEEEETSVEDVFGPRARTEKRTEPTRVESALSSPEEIQVEPEHPQAAVEKDKRPVVKTAPNATKPLRAREVDRGFLGGRQR